MGGGRFDMHLFVEAGSGKLSQAGCVMRVGLVRLKCLQAFVGLHRIDAHYGNAERTQTVTDRLRHAAGFDHRPFD